ncbi:M48 family metallopeptidase [Inhella gelatinilytica]|uniref:M48 family metallopeptidase n=1 Tax=Inhella gelatinilytica TaxID=2795030 RepID=A0A931NDB7_9BURK|nr:SprT family zinc-dependent metalloprotease [Inhella gelatinilytica]MBH9551286.1 M48 family metallopeptidase [Inhella gelatinilytica]
MPNSEAALGGVPWVVHRSRRRSIGLRVDAQGLQVRAPHAVSQAYLESVLRARWAWVEHKWQEARQRAHALESLRLKGVPGETLLYRGEPVLLVQGAGKVPRWVEGAPSQLHLPGPPGESWTRMARKWLQDQARAALQACVQDHTQRLGLPAPAIRLSNAKGRWGSASSRGTLSLHWRLIQLRPHLLRHVVAHEVAHLREMNHSPRFWSWVAVLDPDYRASRAELKQVQLPPW